jgi:hypothetical protein
MGLSSGTAREYRRRCEVWESGDGAQQVVLRKGLGRGDGGSDGVAGLL